MIPLVPFRTLSAPDYAQIAFDGMFSPDFGFETLPEQRVTKYRTTRTQLFIKRVINARSGDQFGAQSIG